MEKIRKLIRGVKSRGHIFSRHLVQSSSACLTAMVQGDLSALTYLHWEVALTTGFFASTIGCILSLGRLIRFYESRWFYALASGFGTFAADYYTHPSHFGGPWGEPAVTALGAVLSCLLLSIEPINRVTTRIEDKIWNALRSRIPFLSRFIKPPT